MRHRKKINHLGRKSQHRNAMLSNMASSLILHKRIFTTVAKAKALRVYVEPLITKSKEDSTHSRRTVFAYLQNKHAVSELFREVSQKVAERPGGYTRILKTGFRQGDAAEMCFIELVDYNTNMLKIAEDTSKKTRRSRRGKKSSVTEPKDAATAEAEEKTEKAAVNEEEKPEVDAVVETPVDEQTKEAEATEKAEEVPVSEEPVVAETKEKEEEPKAEKKEEKPKAEKKAEESKAEKKEEEPKVEKKEEKPKAEKKEKEPKADTDDDAEEKKEDK